jgi:hypothetical protein
MYGIRKLCQRRSTFALGTHLQLWDEKKEVMKMIRQTDNHFSRGCTSRENPMIVSPFSQDKHHRRDGLIAIPGQPLGEPGCRIHAPSERHHLSVDSCQISEFSAFTIAIKTPTWENGLKHLNFER